jgi:hypothetical protein
MAPRKPGRDLTSVNPELAKEANGWDPSTVTFCTGMELRELLSLVKLDYMLECSLAKLEVRGTCVDVNAQVKHPALGGWQHDRDATYDAA